MKTYKLTIAYDAANYYGWQVQSNKPSIAETLNRAFEHAFKLPMNVLGTSRTDAGVHALGQVARARIDLAIGPEKLKWIWNNMLPPDIMIRSIELVDDDFNPFHYVSQKIYYYHFFLERPLPFIQRYGYFYSYAIDLDLLREALQVFVGTHDFSSFRSSEDTRENRIRTIDSIGLHYFKRYNVYRITVTGQKFLRHMIRRIVGASLSVATQGKLFGAQNIDPLQFLHDTLQAADPGHVLPNAPAQGLMLYKIIYER